MREPAEAWIRRRAGSVPEELSREVQACLASVPPGSASCGQGERLAAAALRTLDDVAAGPGDREAALRLLAADASLTYAFEAAAELGEDVLALADGLGVRGALGDRLAEAGGGGGRV